MATINQINYLKINSDFIKEPVLIVGSKQYDFDKMNIRKFLTENGFREITGLDLFEGEGVDIAADITDHDSEFMKRYRNFFNTVICMEVMTHVKNPFSAAHNLTEVLKSGGNIILSECYVRKISKMPADLWRFTYDGTKVLFSSFEFYDSKAMISFTRDKNENLMPLKYPLPQILKEKHEDESSFGHLLRRVHDKYFSKGIFRLSRYFPETTIYSSAKKL